MVWHFLTRAAHVADIERRHHARITGQLITELKHAVQLPDGPLLFKLKRVGFNGHILLRLGGDGFDKAGVEARGIGLADNCHRTKGIKGVRLINLLSAHHVT